VCSPLTIWLAFRDPLNATIPHFAQPRLLRSSAAGAKDRSLSHERVGALGSPWQAGAASEPCRRLRPRNDRAVVRLRAGRQIPACRRPARSDVELILAQVAQCKSPSFTPILRSRAGSVRAPEAVQARFSSSAERSGSGSFGSSRLVCRQRATDHAGGADPGANPTGGAAHHIAGPRRPTLRASAFLNFVCNTARRCLAPPRPPGGIQRRLGALPVRVRGSGPRRGHSAGDFPERLGLDLLPRSTRRLRQWASRCWAPVGGRARAGGATLGSITDRVDGGTLARVVPCAWPLSGAGTGRMGAEEPNRQAVTDQARCELLLVDVRCGILRAYSGTRAYQCARFAVRTGPAFFPVPARSTATGLPTAGPSA